MGASQANGLGNAKASEPHSGLGPTGAIPSAAVTAWIEERREICRLEWREATAEDDAYSQALATGARLELIALEKFLVQTPGDEQ